MKKYIIIDKDKSDNHEKNMRNIKEFLNDKFSPILFCTGSWEIYEVNFEYNKIIEVKRL